MKKWFSLLLALMLLTSMAPLALADEPVTLTIMRNEHASFSYSMEQPVIAELEKRLGINIDLKIYPASDYNTKLGTLLGTNDLPDITLSTYTKFANYVSEEMFVNLTEHWDKLPNYAATVERFSDLANAFKVDGQMYWFIMTAEDAEAYGNTPLVRKDILSEIGWDKMPDNFDELYEMLKAMKEKYPDSIPFVTRGTDVLWRMGFTYGTYNGIYFEPDSGKYEYGPLYDRYRSFLTYMNKLYTEKLLDPDFATSNKAIWMENLTSGKSFFFCDNGSFTTDINLVTTAENPEAKFVPMTTLANPFGGRRNQFFEGVGYISPFRNDVWVINSESEHIDEALRFMDYLYSEEGAMLCSYGIEGEHYTVKDGKVELIMEPVNYYKENANDPYREYKNSLGTGALAVSGRFYETRKWFLDEDSNAMYQFWLDDPNMLPYTYTLCLSQEQSDAVVDKKTSCDTYVSSESLKFIMGTRPLEEFDVFVAELIKMGAKDVEAVYNEAYQASLK